MENNILPEEIPKHRKKRTSSKSKSYLKSNHKHEYVDALFIHNFKPHRGTYCRVCGKIGNMFTFETECTEDGYYRTLNPQEIFSKYPNHERIKIDDLWQKYVAVNVGDDGNVEDS